MFETFETDFNIFQLKQFHTHPQLPKLPTTEVLTLILPLDKVKSNSPLLEHETSSGGLTAPENPPSFQPVLRGHDKIDDL